MEIPLFYHKPDEKDAIDIPSSCIAGLSNAATVFHREYCVLNSQKKNFKTDLQSYHTRSLDSILLSVSRILFSLLRGKARPVWRQATE